MPPGPSNPTDFDLDVAFTDWGTVTQRRNSHEPVDKGGWSVMLTGFPSFDFADPAGNPLVRGNGLQGFPGWPSSPRVEALRDAWFAAPTLADQQAVCADIQRTVLDEVLFIPVGAYFLKTALRSDLAERVPGFPLFWNLRRV